MKHSIVSGRDLSRKNVEFYKEEGYLIAPGLMAVEDIGILKKEAVQIFRGNREHVDGLMDVQGLPDDEVLKKYVAIHFPHKISRAVENYLSHPGITGILTGIVGPNVKCMQSMLFVKGPGKAGQSWHQDEFYIPTRDRSLVGAWIAIDDATVDNGCLWIVPGSHKSGILFRRVPSNSSEYADVDTVDVSALSADQLMPVEVEKGSVVFFNGYTLHSSRRNVTKDCFRMALVNHYMSAESLLPWDQDGKLQPTEDLRDIVMVAGMDPYAWKGITDLNKPYLRPEILKIKTQ
ncbi:MAG TPA: phytanoyl-CoA dioxygenase family protein [Puia sp.]|nr:phytanoyl-CoA dioxygenase family protein [Puia sp.]